MLRAQDAKTAADLVSRRWRLVVVVCRALPLRGGIFGRTAGGWHAASGITESVGRQVLHIQSDGGGHIYPKT